ncbi:MAG: hypothetical protein ABIJ65_01860 [Chloroflexota bacterium]
MAAERLATLINLLISLQPRCQQLAGLLLAKSPKFLYPCIKSMLEKERKANEKQ